MDANVNFDPREDAYSKPLDKIDVSDPRLYYDDIWRPYFERLRREDPVHFTPESPYGPYWAVTKYRDIVQVEVNHKVFSSSDEVGGIRSMTRRRAWNAPASSAWIRRSTTISGVRSAPRSIRSRWRRWSR